MLAKNAPWTILPTTVDTGVHAAVDSGEQGTDGPFRPLQVDQWPDAPATTADDSLRRMIMFHIGWAQMDAKLIDKRFIKRTSDNIQVASTQVWEYLIEFTGPDGTAIRLPIREETFKLRDPHIGSKVPILVNKARSKAAFNLKDPRINAMTHLKSREAEQKAADKARFEARLNEIRPPEDP